MKLADLDDSPSKTFVGLPISSSEGKQFPKKIKQQRVAQKLLLGATDNI